MTRRAPGTTLFPYTTLFRSRHGTDRQRVRPSRLQRRVRTEARPLPCDPRALATNRRPHRSEEHTSELQSRRDLVCRLLLEKKKSIKTRQSTLTNRFTTTTPN